MLKKVFKLLVLPFFKLIVPLFYDRKYLRGKYFDEQMTGWAWVWRCIWFQKLFGYNSAVPWPMTPMSRISNPKNIVFDPEDLANFQSPGCYYQNFAGTIYLGKGTYIAPNVGLITANHDLNDLAKHVPGQDIVIGERCWLGMNVVVLPGVTLGDQTIVAAGSVVTKSFPEGKCVIGGSPARILKQLDDEGEAAQ